MINCLVRSLRKRRPSIRADWEPSVGDTGANVYIGRSLFLTMYLRRSTACAVGDGEADAKHHL
jgi:hypothetical protein